MRREVEFYKTRIQIEPLEGLKYKCRIIILCKPIEKWIEGFETDYLQ